MRGFDPFRAFGKEVAETYDDFPRGDEAETVDFLQDLAAVGPVLELAIGTGRIGLPLASRGVRVDGVEISPEMIAKLRAKPGGDRIAVTMGDFADVPVEGRYRLIYVVFNTFLNLLTQDDQVRCFQNVAAHLTDDGRFVIEAETPGWLYRLRNHQYVDAETVEADVVRFDVARFDPLTQILDESHVALTPDGIRLSPIVTRYAWPSELDLMARIAGLRLIDRWGGWKGEPFIAESRRHISVFGR
jgi:SAM-dependent methyltransferase